MFIHLAEPTNFLPLLSICGYMSNSRLWLYCLNSLAPLSLTFYHLLNSRYENHSTQVSKQI